MDINTFSTISISGGTVILPDDFFLQIDFLHILPSLMKQNVSVLEHMNIMVPRVPLIPACRFLGPDDISIRLGNRENVFPVRCTHQHQTVLSKRRE